MKKILISSSIYKGERRIFLKFRYDDELINIIKLLDDARWSREHKMWHVRDSHGMQDKILQIFSGVAELEAFSIIKKGSVSPGSLSGQPCYEIDSILHNFREYLAQLRYSENTIKTYTESLGIFLRWVSKNMDEINNDDLLRFNTLYILKNGYSRSYQNQVISAIKLYFSRIQKKKFLIDLIERPRRVHKLPNVLSREEVSAIIKSIINLKHRTMISLIYACGLRRNELIKLRVEDIDSKRMLLIIRNSKGMKDRVIPVSDKVINMLREY